MRWNQGTHRLAGDGRGREPVSSGPGPFPRDKRTLDAMRTEQISLLKADPDLGALLAEPRRAEAERRLLVSTHRLAVGPWDVTRLSGASADHIGLLVLDGVVARELIVADHVSAELLGPGDLIRPWQAASKSELLPVDAEWSVLSPATLAVLDRRFAAEASHYPEITAALFDRLSERSLRLATTQAISQLTRVDRRLKALFWHLAERWGRVGGDGVVIPLALTHRILGQLVGARRPTVSTALSELAERDELVRRADGSWLLRGDPPDASTLERSTARHARVGDLLRPVAASRARAQPERRRRPGATRRLAARPPVASERANLVDLEDKEAPWPYGALRRHPGRRQGAEARGAHRAPQEGLLDGDRDGDELHRQLDQPRRRPRAGDRRVAPGGHPGGARPRAAVRQRIKELYGVVPGSLEFKAEQSYLQPPEHQTDIVHVIKGVIEAETGAIEHYNRIIEFTDGLDFVTQDMVIAILRDEEGHRRLFEGYLREYEVEGLA